MSELAALSKADYRAWMAARAQRKLQATSTARALSAVKSFYRHAIKRGLIAETGITALRTPKLPRSLPKPLNAGEALEAVSAIGDQAREDWIGKRDIAVLALLYGCGLRISEALGLKRGDVIISLNGKPAASAADVRTAVQEASTAKRTSVLALIQRGNNPARYIGLRIKND